MGRILVGTCSWTDRTLIDSGWYPRSVRSAAGRLDYYAQHFPVVEVDSSYYALPSERNSRLWVERTPEDFTFHVKAYGLFTQHPVRIESLPKDAQRSVPSGRSRVYASHLSAGVRDQLWEMFRSALEPLHRAGKLGYILFQFPEWFTPKAENEEYVLECTERLPEYRCAVEFRQRAWMIPERNAERTLSFLSTHRLPYVCVDMPQGFGSSLPAVAEATADDLAVVRFHGRNRSTWKRKGITTAERFDYLYGEEELRAWVPRLETLAAKVRQVHAVFNNCHQDNAVRNARDLIELIERAGDRNRPDPPGERV